MSSNIWFTSDHHFNHRNIIGYTDRPFPAGDTDAMNAALIDNWNSRIAPGDTVWVLGDFMGMPGGYADRLAAGFLAQLHGDKILVVGNHDTPSGKGPEAVRRHLAVGWTDIVATHTTMGIAGRDVTISHYPWRNGDPNQSKAHLRPVDVAGAARTHPRTVATERSDDQRRSRRLGRRPRPHRRDRRPHRGWPG
jgi:calcineurin-like phosphoesterase family protein